MRGSHWGFFLPSLASVISLKCTSDGVTALWSSFHSSLPPPGWRRELFGPARQSPGYFLSDCSQECGSPGPQVRRDPCVCSQAVSSVSKVSGLELQKEPPLASSCNTWFPGVTPSSTQTLHLLIVCFLPPRPWLLLQINVGFFPEKQNPKSSGASGSCFLPPSASSPDLETHGLFFLPCSF